MFYLEWIAGHRPLVMFLILLCGVVTQILYYRHLRQGKFKTDDLGYFFRLWRNKNRDGRIMIYSTFTAIALAVLLIVSMIVTARI